MTAPPEPGGTRLQLVEALAEAGFRLWQIKGEWSDLRESAKNYWRADAATLLDTPVYRRLRECVLAEHIRALKAVATPPDPREGNR